MTEEKKLLMLFDGNALIHRGYHALPPLTLTKTGESVNAVYGFASMVLKVLIDFKPTHWAVAFDMKAPTFRHTLFEDYKAQRPKAPDDLVNQFQRVRELVNAFHLPIFELEGFEADDLLGGLSRQASNQGIDTIIVTGDADAMQLVSPQVKVLTPQRSFGDIALCDQAAVEAKYGVTPAQIPDLKGLEGDTSDNIKGVPGIGRKTAVKLLQQFGSVEGIYDHLDNVTPEKLRQILTEHQADARQSLKLATIVSDVPISLNLETCQVSAFDREKVVALFRELEFVSLLPRLSKLQFVTNPQATTEPLKVVSQHNYRMINTPQLFADLLSKLTALRWLAVDTETTSLNVRQAELVGISLSWAPGEAAYIPVGHHTLEQPIQLPLEQVVGQLKPILENTAIPKVAHNGKYDMGILARYGIEIHPLSSDTMIAAYLLNEKALNLKAVAFSKLGIEMTPIQELIGSGKKQLLMSQVNVDEAARYACADADMTGQLSQMFEKELKDQGLWQLFSEVEMPLVPILWRMESNGVALDSELLRQLSQNLGKQIYQLEHDIYNSVGHQFNVNSPQQLGKVLYDELNLQQNLPKSRKNKSGYSTEAAVLETLREIHPVVDHILRYRELTKLKSTYIDVLPGLVDNRTGRIYTCFNQTGTTTGRLSSSDPNLQNIPVRGDMGKKIRQAFISQPPCVLLAGDYSQIDLRALAHLSRDPSLMAAFHNNEDIHTATASQVFGVGVSAVTPDMRRVAKTANFGIIYGMSDYGLEQATGLSREESTQFIKKYFEKYQGVKTYLEATKQQARDRGYVETLLGRRRYISEIKSDNFQVRSAAERMAINMPVQGTSADIIKVAMINMQREMYQLKLKSKLILQIHDELIFEVPPEELDRMKVLVPRVMCQAINLSVPVKVDIKLGHNWGEME
jgi:DNA polymerase I